MLITDFKKYTLQDFEAAFQKEVKGGNFRDLLTWHTDEGIDVSPFYFETNTKVHLSSNGNEWEINAEIIFTDVKEGNRKALEKLNEGATSITFIGEIKNANELAVLLNEIGIQFIEVNFKICRKSIVHFYKEYCREKNILLNELKGCFYLLEIEKDASVFPQMQLFSVDGCKFHNTGGNSIQQLAFSIAEGKELLEKCLENGFSPENAIRNIRFSMAVGPDFFFEIAKIRALKLLWRNVTEQYLKGNSIPLHIHAETSQIWLANEDVNNNLIRAAFQTLSATAGGCNSFYAHPFSNQNEDASRLGIGVQLVVREEGFLNKVGDVAAGAYYIEEITEKLVLNAWKEFQEIEKTGGYATGIKSEKITKALHESALKLKQNIASGKIKVIGVNKHRTDKTEKILRTKISYTGKIEKINLFN